MTTYIGLTAQKGVGKSTLAAMLQELLPGAEIIAFADSLKRRVRCMLEEEDIWLEDSEIESLKATCLGPIYQGFGELMRLKFGPNCWINQLYRDAHCIDTVIIPDVRHVNEAEWIKAQGGLLVAIIGPSRWEGDQRDDNHPSEAHVRECQEMADLTIHNGFSLDFLCNRAQDIVNHVA